LSPLFATGVVDTGGKFAAGVVDTTTQAELVAKFAAGVDDTCGNLPPALLTPAANFPAGIVDTGGVNNTSGTGGKICHRCR
jgi:hypothetical protein